MDSLFTAENCRSAHEGDLLFSNSLPSSAAPEGQPEKEQIEAASTVFDLKHTPVECVSPENDSKSKLRTCS